MRRRAVAAAMTLLFVAAATAAAVAVPLMEPRTWIDGFPVGMELHCHDDGCRATVSHALLRLDALEPDHPAIVHRRTFRSGVRNAAGSYPIFRTPGQQAVVALTLADGSARVRLVSCGRFWKDDPFACADWSLAEVEALVGDQ